MPDPLSQSNLAESDQPLVSGHGSNESAAFNDTMNAPVFSSSTTTSFSNPPAPVVWPRKDLVFGISAQQFNTQRRASNNALAFVASIRWIHFASKNDRIS